LSATLAQRLERAVRPLADPPGPLGWNHAELSDLLADATRAPAAVLVPIVRRDELSVLLTQRTDHLARHAGQVSFPGGRSEPDDADAVATALRETREEVGIDPTLVVPFGYLDCLETVSGYCVTPVVAWLDAGYRVQPDPREVADVFEVPLDVFLTPSKLRRTRMQFRGRARDVLEFDHPGPRIWGATAMMLHNLVERLGAAP
jgi:8-oxo-dGTP pyrophosphatase MutT (NUDIX family)